MSPSLILLALLAAVLISAPWIVVVDRLIRSHEAMHNDLTDVENHLHDITDSLATYFREARPDQRHYQAARCALVRLGSWEEDRVA